MKLEHIVNLTNHPDIVALERELRTYLADPAAKAVAYAAEIAAHRSIDNLIPEMLAAYDHLFVEPEKTDPDAIGKQTVVQALQDLAYHNPAPYLRGLHYYEPYNQGIDDRAAQLRATCARGLVHCDLDRLSILQILIEHLVDRIATVRSDVIGSIAQLGGTEALLLIRFKALSGDEEGDVISACFTALLEMDPHESITFIAKFLKTNRIIEAVTALASLRNAIAFPLITERWTATLSDDVRRAIIYSAATCPLPIGCEFLLTIIANDPQDNLVQWAIEAIALSKFKLKFQDRVYTLVQQSESLAQLATYNRFFD